MNKIWQIYRINLYSIYAEKGEMLMWAVQGAAGSLVGALPWLLLGTIQDEINGHSIDSISMYYFITFIMWYISGGSFGWGIRTVIRTGSLSNFLTRPYFPFADAIIGEQAWKTLGLLASLPIFLIIVGLSIGFNTDIIQLNNVLNWLLLLPATVLIFGLIEFTKSMAGFWLTKVNGVFSLVDVVTTLFGGLIAPMYLLPIWLQSISKVLPFQYIFGFPTAVVVGEVEQSMYIEGITISYLWVVILFVIAYVLYKLGIRKYEAVGN